jgi:cytochrome c
MKHKLLTFSCALMLASCGSPKTDSLSSDSSASADHSAATRQSEAVQDTSLNNIGTDRSGGSSAKGAELIASSDCLSCHKEKDKLVGPAYNAIAAKYPNTEANAEMLAGKIITGGSGNWGDIPMTPHPALSKSDALEMAKYILTLK